jgi:hypothetical protein
MLEGGAFGILVGAGSAAVSFLIMRNHTGEFWGALAYVGAFVSGFAIALAILVVLAAIGTSREDFSLMMEGFVGTAMLGVVFGSGYGPLASSIFVRHHPASGGVASRNGQTVIDITGLRKGRRDMITLAMSEPEWHNLQAVRDVLSIQLERNELPAELPDATAPPASADDARSTGAKDPSTSWIFLTGRRRDTGEIATIAVPKKQWRDLSPLQWAVKKALRGQGAEPATLRGGPLFRLAALIALLVFVALYWMTLRVLSRFLVYLWHLL